MNRLEFMSELEHLLADISKNEREEALNYYNDYLDYAGVENEEEVIESLGSPAKVAATIKAGLFSDEEGAFTENGYLDYEEEKKNTVTVRTKEEQQEKRTEPEDSFQQSTQEAEKSAGETSGDAYRGEHDGKPSGKPVPRRRNSGGSLAWILLCVLFAPFLIVIGMVAAVLILAFVITVAAVVFSIFIAVGSVALALLLTGIVLVAVGIGKFFISPLGGITLFGGGACCVGIGLLFLALTVWMIGSLLPGVIRFIVDLLSGLFHRKRGVRA